MYISYWFTVKTASIGTTGNWKGQAVMCSAFRSVLLEEQHEIYVRISTKLPLSKRVGVDLVCSSASWLLGYPEPWDLKLERECLFRRNVCNVNGFLNKLSIVPPLGLFFTHSSALFNLFQATKDITPSRERFARFPSSTSYSLCQTADLIIDPIWSCRFPFESTPTAHGWGRCVCVCGGGGAGGVVAGKWQKAMTLRYDRFRGCKVSNVSRRGSYILLSFKYTLRCWAVSLNHGTLVSLSQKGN